MAKYRSIIEIEGTLGDYTYYRMHNRSYVRRKSSLSKKRIKEDPAFARTRENNTEFGHCARMGKILRTSLKEVIGDAKDVKMSSRLTKTLMTVKNADIHTARGSRLVSQGLKTEAGRQALTGFNFNANAALEQILICSYDLDLDTGDLTLPNFSPKAHLQTPKVFTDVVLQSFYLNLDFDTGESLLTKSEAITFSNTQSQATSLTLAPPFLPEGSGARLYFLKISFFKSVQGKSETLNVGVLDSLRLIGVKG